MDNNGQQGQPPSPTVSQSSLERLILERTAGVLGALQLEIIQLRLLIEDREARIRELEQESGGSLPPPSKLASRPPPKIVSSA